MTTIYKIHCISCGELIKNARPKEEMQFTCNECLKSFSILHDKNISRDLDGYDISVTIPVKSISSSDWYNGAIPPEHEILYIDDERTKFYPIHCIMCGHILKGKHSVRNSIEIEYVCTHCRNIYHVSFFTKEK